MGNHIEMVPEQLEGILSFMKIAHSMNDDLDIHGFLSTFAKFLPYRLLR